MLIRIPLSLPGAALPARIAAAADDVVVKGDRKVSKKKHSILAFLRVHPSHSGLYNPLSFSKRIMPRWKSAIGGVVICEFI